MDFTLIIILLAIALALAAIVAVIRQMSKASASLNASRIDGTDSDSTDYLVDDPDTTLDDPNAHLQRDSLGSGGSEQQGDAIFHAVDTARENVEQAVESSFGSSDSSSSDSGGSSDGGGGGGGD